MAIDSEYIITSLTGAKGAQGDPGVAGAPGVRAIRYLGKSVTEPDSSMQSQSPSGLSVPLEGDWYLCTENGNVYCCTNVNGTVFSWQVIEWTDLSTTPDYRLLACLEDLLLLSDSITDNVTLNNVTKKLIDTLVANRAFIKELFATNIILNEEWKNAKYLGDTISSIQSASYSVDARNLTYPVVGKVKGFKLEAYCQNGITPQTGILAGKLGCAYGNFNTLKSEDVQARTLKVGAYQAGSGDYEGVFVETNRVSVEPVGGLSWYLAPNSQGSITTSDKEAYIDLADRTIGGTEKRCIWLCLNPYNKSGGADTFMIDGSTSYPDIIAVNRSTGEYSKLPRARLSGTTLYLDF